MINGLKGITAKLLIDAMLDPVLVLDSKGLIVTQNTASNKLFGYTQKNIAGKHFFDCGLASTYSAKELRSAKSSFEAAINEDKGFTLEYDFVTKKSKLVHVLISGFLLKDKKDKIHRIIVILKDITEQKVAEAALRESQEKYHGVIENLMEGFYSVTLDGKLLYYNIEFTRLLGLDPNKDYSGMALPDFWQDPEDRKKYLEEFMKNGFIKNYIVNAKKSDGENIVVQAFSQLIKDEKGNPVRIEGTFLDITERVRAERIVIESEERLSAFMNSATDGVLLLDSDMNVVMINPVALNVFPEGTKREDIVGSNLEDIAPGLKESGRYDMYKKVIATGIPFFNEDFRPDEKFGDIYLDLRAFKVGDGLGIVSTNITSRKRMEADLRALNEELEERVTERTKELVDTQDQLVRSERMAVLGKLSGGIGHELRNPLGAIKNSVFLLKMAMDQEDQDVIETLDILELEVSTCERIIQSLLSFAQPKPPVRQKIQVNVVINNTISKTQIPGEIKVLTQLDPELPMILADPTQIGQLVVNVVRNALQAMPDGGELTISTQSVDEKWIMLSFRDTGVGIPEENLGKLFEPLFTTKAKGIGLGLAISKMMVDAHEGSIEVQSVVGKGTTLTVKLPMPVRKKE